MTWLIFALLTAFFDSAKDVASKKGLMAQDEYVVSWSLRFFALPFLLPLLFFVKIPHLGEQFLAVLLAVAFIWSLTANLDKIGVQNSSPIFWIIAINIFIALVLSPNGQAVS